MTETDQHIPPGRDDQLVAGDTAILVDTITNSDGEPARLGGASVRFQLAEYPGAPALVEKDTDSDDVAVTDADNGEVTIELQPEDTADLGDREGEEYHYEIEIEDQVGNVATVTTGTFTIRDSSI